jgi:hypothetical protein
MQKTMKSSTTNKVVIVKLNGKKNQVTVDSAIHEDIFIEAATQVVERYRKDLAFFHKIRIIGECYEKVDETNLNKHYQINMYHILMNAGLYSVAELLRTKAKNLHQVDLRLEPARANAGQSNT